MWDKLKQITSEIAAFFWVEIKMIFTDAGAILFFFIAMFIYSFLYAMGYEKETVRDLPVAVVDLDHSATSRQFSRMADATEQLHVSIKPESMKEAEELFYDGKITGVILIPANFEKDILNGKRTSISAYCDVSYFMMYKQVYAGAVYSSGTFGAGVEIKRMLAEGKSLGQAMDMQEPVKVQTYNLYNPSGGYGSFIMPPVIIIIMQQLLLVGIGMLGGTIRERRIFLQMNNSVTRKLGSIRLVFAKASAYVVVFLITCLFSLGVLHRWLAFPDQVHFWPMVALLIPFLYTVSFLGLAISMLFTERIHSIVFLVFISPILVFISGISWPTSSVPDALYAIVHVLPSTFMIPAYLHVRVMGAGFDSIHYELTWILIQMVAYFVLACFAYKFSIRRFGKRIGDINKD